MKTIFDHIEEAKGRPHHIRERIAFGTAAVCTAAIALTWLASSIKTGAFALKNTSFAQTGVEQASPAVSNGKAEDTQFAGAAAAVRKSANAPARIEIVDAAPEASSEDTTEQTVIPF